MTPHDFLRKWRGVELKERTASQSHFNDLCALLGVLDPISADPAGEWFTFERGATKTGGGEGWADVWRRGCFAWEYKGPGKDLDRAYAQLLQYAVALENPPLLIVSDMDRIRLHTNWTNTVQEVHQFTLDDLIDADARERLKRAFTDPEWFKPAKTRQALTEETAREFAGLAQRLRDRGHEAGQVAHFVNRLVFCMFAEDVGLLPDNLFTKMLEVSRRDPDGFADNARQLFGAMATKGGKVGFTPVDWFNGGLFEDDRVLPVSADDIDELLRAAKRDWSAIDPSILGTLFERGLDPAKRSQLGAHYTDRAKIMQIVQPVIIDPLEAEWAAAWRPAMTAIDDAQAKAERALAKAVGHNELSDEVLALRASFKDDVQYVLFEELSSQKRVRSLDIIRASLREASRTVQAARTAARRVRDDFLTRLRDFRVLDPACGSGNFLYVSLNALKDMEHKVNIEAERAGIGRSAPLVGPECVLGIELNPYAAELAQVSVWIGEIQWMRRNGFDAARNPILRPLDTIECRDAVLAADGTRAEWPSADVVVGNPPFLGNKKMIRELGEGYTAALRKAWPEVPNGVDLVCYWFAKAWAMIPSGKLDRVGLVATQSIRRGTNRKVLQPVVDHGRIFNVWSDQEWTVDGADVRVSLLCFDAETPGQAELDGQPVGKISADLKADSAQVKPTFLYTNAKVAGQGTISGGPFELPPTLARNMLVAPLNPNGRSNLEVIRPWRNGDDLTDRPADWWIIDFSEDVSAEQAALFEQPFKELTESWDSVQRARLANGEKLLRAGEPKTAARWWVLQRRRSGLLRDLRAQQRYLVTPRVSKHRFFVWQNSTIVPDTRLVAFRKEDDAFAGVLHSRFHEIWSLRFGAKHGVGNDPEYVHTATFETFPFPQGLTPDIPADAYADDPRAHAIAAAAARLDELRENWLNPADLVVREPEVVPGYPDRILPRDSEAAKELKKRTLTNLYNARPAWLANAHAALDQAVADAYGWGEDWRAGTLTDDEILARLFRLNQERAA